MADKLTGKASYFIYGGTTFCITKYSTKVTRALADTTDSCDYSSSIDLVNMSQIPVSVTQELTVEGNFHLSQTTQGLLTSIYSGANAIPVTLGLNAGVLLGTGNFDISDFSCDVPVVDTCKFTATFKSNGAFTPGS